MNADTGQTSSTPTSTASAEPPAGSDSRRWWALAVIAAATLLVVLDASIVNIALPSAQADLGVSDADRQWVLTAYALAFGGLLVLGGRIADLIGRKRAFVVGLVGFAVASAVGGAAQEAWVLFTARGGQGAFAALLAPAALSLLAVTFVDPRERATAFGVYGAVAGAGGALGLLLGGVLTELGSWRWTLFVNVPIALVVVLAATVTLRESRSGGPRHVDAAGAVLATTGLVALVLGATWAAEGGWLGARTLGLLGTAVVLLVAFVVRESRTAHPLLPLGLVRDRDRGGALLGSLLLAGGMFAMFLFLAYYLQVNLGYGPVGAGAAVLPFAAGIVAASVAAARLLPRVGPKPLLVGGMALATAGMAWMAQVDSASTLVTGVLLPQAVMGVGLGLVLVAVNSVALTGVPPEQAGVASALVSTSQQVGGALGVALLNTLYASAVAERVGVGSGVGGRGAEELAAYLAGYRTAFAVGGVLFAAALVVFTLMVTARRQATPATPALVDDPAGTSR